MCGTPQSSRMIVIPAARASQRATSSEDSPGAHAKVISASARSSFFIEGLPREVTGGWCDATGPHCTAPVGTGTPVRFVLSSQTSAEASRRHRGGLARPRDRERSFRSRGARTLGPHRYRGAYARCWRGRTKRRFGVGERPRASRSMMSGSALSNSSTRLLRSRTLVGWEGEVVTDLFARPTPLIYTHSSGSYQTLRSTQ